MGVLMSWQVPYQNIMGAHDWHFKYLGIILSHYSVIITVLTMTKGLYIRMVLVS